MNVITKNSAPIWENKLRNWIQASDQLETTVDNLMNRECVISETFLKCMVQFKWMCLYSWRNERQPGCPPPLAAHVCFPTVEDHVSLNAHSCFPSSTCLFVLLLLLISRTEAVPLYILIQYLQLTSKRQMSPLGFAARMATFLCGAAWGAENANAIVFTGDDSQSLLEKNVAKRAQAPEDSSHVLHTEPLSLSVWLSCRDSCYDFWKSLWRLLSKAGLLLVLVVKSLVMSGFNLCVWRRLHQAN